MTYLFLCAVFGQYPQLHINIIWLVVSDVCTLIMEVFINGVCWMCGVCLLVSM